MTERIQYPLTIFIPLKKDRAAEIREKFKKSNGAGGALASTGLVHFARLFVFEENNIMGIPSNIAVVSTTYDGDFVSYVQAFVDNPDAAEVFNMLLKVADVPGAQDLIPVHKNAKAFADLVVKYDATNKLAEPWGEWFSAYPGATVGNIKKALNNQS